MEELHCLLTNVPHMLPLRTTLRGKQLPILCIVEANHLQTLQQDPNGQSVLESLFEWFVINMYQGIAKFQVMLISSDSFFSRWVEMFVGATCYKPYVFGHLGRPEAKKYWKQLVQDHHNWWPWCSSTHTCSWTTKFFALSFALKQLTYLVVILSYKYLY